MAGESILQAELASRQSSFYPDYADSDDPSYADYMDYGYDDYGDDLGDEGD